MITSPPTRLVLYLMTALLSSVAPVACSRPQPTTNAASGAGSEHVRTIVSEARTEPAPSAMEIASASAVSLGDLETMRSRGVIRVLVASNRTDYFIDGGKQYGAAFDAGKAFQSFANAALNIDGATLRVMFIPTPPEQLLSALTGGHGDIVAGRVAKTFEREEVVAFSEPIVSDVREVLVTGPGVHPIVSLEDVAGRSIHVRNGSDHFSSLRRLNGQLAKINKPVCTIVAMDPALTDEDLLRMVNDGRVPVTLVDHDLAAAWRPVLGKIAINPDVSVSQDGVYAWVVRKDSPKLLALVNEFIRTHELRGLAARHIRRARL